MVISAYKNGTTNVSFRVISQDAFKGSSANVYLGGTLLGSVLLSPVQNIAITSSNLTDYQVGSEVILKIAIKDENDLVVKTIEIPVTVCSEPPACPQEIVCGVVVRKISDSPSAFVVSAGMRLYDSVRKCWWHQTVSNGEFVWVVED